MKDSMTHDMQAHLLLVEGIPVAAYVEYTGKPAPCPDDVRRTIHAHLVAHTRERWQKMIRPNLDRAPVTHCLITVTDLHGRRGWIYGSAPKRGRVKSVALIHLTDDERHHVTP